MRKNYDKRLENLNKRRYDELIKKAILSESFHSENFGKSTKYVFESMREIDSKYTSNTFEASEKIQKHLRDGLSEIGIIVDFEHQGSVPMNTHIKLHSDIDLVTLHGGFYSLEPPLEPAIPYNGDPIVDLRKLREESFKILNNIYDQVDNSNSKSIAVYPTQPKRKVDVVQANWFDSIEYVNNNREKKFRGFSIFDYHLKTRKTDFPLLNIFNIIEKDTWVRGALRRSIRFLKTLKVDAEYEIKLSSYEISTIVYNIEEYYLNKPEKQTLLLLPIISNHLNEIITNKNFRDNLKSANDKEFVFKGCNDAKVLEIKKLKREVDEIIEDLKEELSPLYKSIENEIVY